MAIHEPTLKFSISCRARVFVWGDPKIDSFNTNFDIVNRISRWRVPDDTAVQQFHTADVTSGASRPRRIEKKHEKDEPESFTMNRRSSSKPTFQGAPLRFTGSSQSPRSHSRSLPTEPNPYKRIAATAQNPGFSNRELDPGCAAV